MSHHQDYTLTPIKVGAEVTGIDLKQPVSDETISRIKLDLTKHRILFFKHQGVVPPDRQIEITQWLGECEIAGFEQHPQSPDRRVLRVSNDESEGLREFGIQGYHIDGMFLEKPNSHSIYHIVDVPKEGTTVFFGLNEVYRGLRRRDRERWKCMWVVKKFNRVRGINDTPGVVIHPLVHKHPDTGQKVLCIHVGKTAQFIINRGTKHQRRTGKEETKEILAEIKREIERNNRQLLYDHQWEAGDFIMSDNLAVGHLATPSTQRPVEEVGLRVMHRTIVAGTYRPDRAPYVRKYTCVIS